MTAEEVKQRLENVFVRTVGMPVPPLDTPRADLALWDSLQHAQLIVSLQTEFSVRFTTEEILAGESYGSLLRILLKKLAV